MRSLTVVVMLTTLTCVHAGAQDAGINGSKVQLVGTWRLVSRAVTSENGKPAEEPVLGAVPVGYLMYDTTGHMAVQLMRQSRSKTIDCAVSSSGPSDNSPLFVNGYEAYFGTYTVDDTKHTVTHHLEGALAASDLGKDLVRHFQISGDKLTITLTTHSPQGLQNRTLMWERVR